MRKSLLTIAALLALLAPGSPLCKTAQAGANGPDMRIFHRHIRHVAHDRVIAPPSSDITSFSASSALSVGVNHPAKK
jgi:hypothetical protein